LYYSNYTNKIFFGNTMPSRNKTQKRRGGNFTIASLGKAAMDVLIPASLFYAAKRAQKGRSIRKMLKRR
jgi:hypothetical protein